jgi:hypothetical protein
MWWRAPRSSRSDIISRRDASNRVGSSPGATTTASAKHDDTAADYGTGVSVANPHW